MQGKNKIFKNYLYANKFQKIIFYSKVLKINYKQK